MCSAKSNTAKAKKNNNNNPAVISQSHDPYGVEALCFASLYYLRRRQCATLWTCEHICCTAHTQAVVSLQESRTAAT